MTNTSKNMDVFPSGFLRLAMPKKPCFVPLPAGLQQKNICIELVIIGASILQSVTGMSSCLRFGANLNSEICDSMFQQVKSLLYSNMLHIQQHTHNSTFLACSVNDTAPSAPGGHPTRGDATLWHATFGHAAVAHARFGHTTTGHAAVGHAAVGHAAVGHPTRLLGLVILPARICSASVLFGNLTHTFRYLVPSGKTKSY